jgi:hypothetical protein
MSPALSLFARAAARALEMPGASLFLRTGNHYPKVSKHAFVDFQGLQEWPLPAAIPARQVWRLVSNTAQGSEGAFGGALGSSRGRILSAGPEDRAGVPNSALFSLHLDVFDVGRPTLVLSFVPVRNIQPQA